MPIIINHLTKKIKDKIIIDNISLKLDYGNIYGLYGKNGEGKSVLLKLIASIYKPTVGEILIDNINYNKRNVFPENMGVLIENPCFFNDLSGYKNLELLANINKKVSDENIMDVLRTVNLHSDKDKKYQDYSIGTKQKLGIAQALMEDPKIIILDEPFNGVDEETIDKISNHLRKIKNNKIIILSSHNKNNLLKYCDKIIYLKNHRILDEK